MLSILRDMSWCRVLVLGGVFGTATVISGAARADVVHLVNGRTMEGIVVEEDAQAVRLQLPFGEIGLPRSSVARIDREVSAFEEYLTRKEHLGFAVSDAEAWLGLARWAQSRSLDHCAREAALVAADLDPELTGLEPLMRAFDYGFDDVRGEWLPIDDLMRRRGYVLSGGRWISPEEALRAQQDREAAWREQRERDRRDRLARAMEMMALAQMVQAEESRLQREQAVGQPYGIPVYGYPIVTWPGYWPRAPARFTTTSRRRAIGGDAPASARDHRSASRFLDTGHLSTQPGWAPARFRARLGPVLTDNAGHSPAADRS